MTQTLYIFHGIHMGADLKLMPLGLCPEIVQLQQFPKSAFSELLGSVITDWAL